MIDVRGVTFSYPFRQEKPALRDVSLSIADGAFVAILGANGSGKSTLARLLNGLLVPQSGAVLVDGQDTSDPALARAVRRTVGMVFQTPDNQIVSTSVEHDVAFALENYQAPPTTMRARVRQALAAVGLAGHDRDNPHDLAASQKQLLAVASTLVIQPRYIVLDEATSFLDGADRQEVLAAVTRLHETMGIGIVLITHLLEETLSAHRVVVLSAGRVVFDGTPQQVFAQPELLLRAWALDVPPLLHVAAGLRARGLPVTEDVTSPLHLVEQLCP